MAPSDSRSRALSLRVPISSEGERSHFQRRLSITFGAVFALALGFFLLQVATLAVTTPERIPHLLEHPTLQIQLLTTFGALAAAVLVRRGQPHPRVLDVADGIVTVALCVGWAALIAPEYQRLLRGELIALLATSYTPRAARRARSQHTCTERRHRRPRDAADPAAGRAHVRQGHAARRDRINHIAYVSIWALVGVACTTTISYVIYGLALAGAEGDQLGQYQLEDKIGEGGMGVVYRAHHALLRRPTAIKLLTANAGNAAERFEREVQVTASLTHPNTVAIYDYGRTPDHVFYSPWNTSKGSRSTSWWSASGRRPCRGSSTSCSRSVARSRKRTASGLVHRDIKPSNVMLTERGGVLDVAKVLDFGSPRRSCAPISR